MAIRTRSAVRAARRSVQPQSTRGAPNANAFKDVKLIGFLDDLQSDVWAAGQETWKRNARRMRGGLDVLDELRPFDWEVEGGVSIKARKASATYVNFGDAYARDMIGHLFRQPPIPDFGSLGQIRADRPGNQLPNEAEQIYESCDASGMGGTAWHPYWARQMRKAVTFGHMVGIAESTRAVKLTKQDELDLGRPFIVHHDPLAVYDQYFDQGDLRYLLVRPKRRLPSVDPKTGRLDKEKSISQDYVLYVAAGYTGFGPLFEAGGFFRFDQQKQYITSGTWERTNGEIPAWFLYYERDEGIDGSPALSRPGVTELGQAAIDYMNTSSAWSFDVWDAAKSIAWITGIDADMFRAAVAKLGEGSRWIPLFTKPMQTTVPAVQDGSMGNATADTFSTRLTAIRSDADRMAQQEASYTPENSGVSKEIGFMESKGPRLALMAQELENAQISALHYIAQRWGRPPDATVSWPERYDLGDKTTRIQAFIEILTTAAIKAHRLRAKAVVVAAQEAQLIAGAEDAKKLEDELTQEQDAAPPVPAPIVPGEAGTGTESTGTAAAVAPATNDVIAQAA